MTFADEIAKTTRRLEVIVYIGGSKLSPWSVDDSATKWPGLLGLTIRKSLESPVPVLSVNVSGGIPTSIRRGMRVEVDLGFNGLFQRVFTGHIQSRERELEESTIQCLGKLYALFRTIEIVERNLDGITIQVAIEGILNNVGIFSGNRALTIPDFTLGSASTPILERMQASQMVQLLMDIEGLRIYETGTGQVVINKVVIAPAAVAFKKYTTTEIATARVIGGSNREDPEFIRTRVTVTGATIVEGTPPNETTRTISSTASLLNPGLLVRPNLPANTFIDAEVLNHLIDTDAKATEVAGRLLQEFSQIPRQIIVEIPGDPQLELAQTIELDLPEYEVSGFWFIYGIEHIIDESGYITKIDLRGGDTIPVTIGINPIADFNFSIDRQVFGDRVYAFVTFDASNSYDPDGTISTYTWSDDEVTAPEITSLTGPIVTVRIDPAVITGTWDVTLTITDNDGLTHAVTKDINVAESQPLVIIPPMFVALNNHAVATHDGGQTWNDQVSSACVAVAARPSHLTGVEAGQALYGCANGDIYRTIDFADSALSLVKTGDGSRIQSIKYIPKQDRVIFALNQQGKIFISPTAGLTWFLWVDLRVQTGLNVSAWMVMSVGNEGIVVAGGDGAGNPIVAISIGFAITFGLLTLGGNIATDHPGGPALRIRDFATRRTGELLIVIQDATGGGASQQPVYYNANIANSAGWVRATGITGSPTKGRFAVPTFTLGRFLVGFDDRDVWVTQNGIAFTQRANVLPLDHVPNHVIWMRDPALDIILPGVYLLALEDTVGQTGGIYKSLDELVSVGAIRPATGFPAWPAGAKGQQLDVGAANTQQQAGQVLMAAPVTAPSRVSAYRKNVFSKTSKEFATEFTGNDVLIPIATNDQVWFIIGFDTPTSFNDSAIQRTKDGGVTWATYTQPKSGNDYWQDFQRAAGGRLWGLTLDITTNINGIAKIWFSDDDGDSWTLSHTETGTSPDQRVLWKLGTHPTDFNLISAMGLTKTLLSPQLGVAFTDDNGSTWTFNENTVSGKTMTNNGHTHHNVIIAPGFKMVISQTITAPSEAAILMSIFGADPWLIRHNFGNTADHDISDIVGSKLGTTLFVLDSDQIVSPFVATVYRSINGGNTWIALDSKLPQFDATYLYRGGLAYDEVNDALYAFGEGGHITNVNLIMKMSPVTQDGVWNDVSNDLVPIEGFTSYVLASFASHGAIIPEP